MSEAWREALAGRPRVGQREQAFSLITVGADGQPHICHLSRAELEADATAVRAVVTSRTARADLGRRGRATLVVVAGREVHSVHLALDRTVEAGDATGLAFAVVGHTTSGMGIVLEPMAYTVPDDLPDREAWDRSQALLEALRSPS